MGLRIATSHPTALVASYTGVMSKETRRPYRVIQVGLGDFGRRWLNVIRRHQSWEYGARATRNGEARRQCGEIAGLPESRQFTSLSDAFESGIDADVVLVTTPHFRHLDDVTVALDHGMHVLVEKPLAGSWDECIRIRAAAARSGGTLTVAENYRFGEGAIAARDIVESGEIGRPEFLTLNYFVGHTFPDGDWRNDYRYPLLVENATHQFDLVRFITGSEATEVYCATPGSKRTPQWEFPSVCAQFQMTGGFHFGFNASWAYKEFPTPWEGQWRLYGTDGALSWDRDQMTIERAGKSRRLQIPSRDSDFTLKATFEEFTASLDQDRLALTDIEDNMKTVAMVYAAIESSQHHRPVDVAEFLEKSDSVDSRAGTSANATR
ncbi:MAG: Gfo/Idh/MocA family oxidoreductase [Spirochaetales bacterium]|nr:MAG: Gfo/Idh/MocA family oxidoreductase [Spirochaetales bacterium]